VGSIDGMLVRDENDKPFLVWKEDGNSRGLPTPIWAQPLSEDGTKLEGDKTQILLNDVPWEGQLIEGPFIFKRNNWFYMVYAGAGCCGRGCNYGVGVARSRNLLKGWEKDPLNPIVKNNEDWKCPGHGSVVTDAEGRDLLLYHAYSTRDTVYVGRQGVVDQLIWGENGWPTINNRRGVAGQVRAQAPGFSDEFNGSELPLGWQWPKGDRPSTTVENGTLLLAPPASRAGDVIGGVVARSTTSGDYTAVTSVETGSLATGTMAGLSAFGDPENALGMGLRSGKLEVWRRQGNNHQVVATLDAPAGAMLHLRMTAREGRLFQFAVSADGTTYTDVGTEQNGEYLPPWDRGVRVALTAGGLTGGSARFSSLVITPVAPAK
jgi:beta-xylosidase